MKLRRLMQASRRQSRSPRSRHPLVCPENEGFLGTCLIAHLHVLVIAGQTMNFRRVSERSEIWRPGRIDALINSTATLLMTPELSCVSDKW